jgi:hypothetical protein
MVTTCYVNNSEGIDRKRTIHTYWTLHQCLLVIHLVSKLNAAIKRKINNSVSWFCLNSVKINQSSHVLHTFIS